MRRDIRNILFRSNNLSMSRSRGDLLYRTEKVALPRFPLKFEFRAITKRSLVARSRRTHAGIENKEKGRRASFDDRLFLHPNCKLSTLSPRFINYSPEHRSTFYAIISLGRNIPFVTGTTGDSNLRFKSKE